ncbi:MAG: DUF4271 domain-containing protein [Saprospiraceae bacterium]|nr:DUF4271 domain-containing protein [Saprospiraceae bacterium]
MLFLCFTITAQDSIPNSVTPPKQNAQIGQDPTTTVSNKANNNTNVANSTTVTPNANTTTITEPSPTSNYTPERQEAKPDPELIAALSNNPFALVRDGKPRISKPKKETLPVSSKTQTEKPAKEVKEVEAEIIQEEPEIFTPVDTSTVALNKLNPFRLEGTAADRKSGSTSKKIKFNPQAGSGAKNETKSTFNPIFDTSKVDVNPLGTLKFTLSILLLGFLTIIVTQFRSEINDIYKAFLNQNLMSLLYREKGTILRLPYVLLYALTALSVGTMIFLTTNIKGITILKAILPL